MDLIEPFPHWPDLDFEKIERAVNHGRWKQPGKRFDEKTCEKISWYCHVFLSVSDTTVLDQNKLRAHYRHIARMMRRYSARRVYSYLKTLESSADPHEQVVARNILTRIPFTTPRLIEIGGRLLTQGLIGHPIWNTTLMRSYAPLISNLHPSRGKEGHQVDYFSGFIDFLQLCFPEGTCYWKSAHWEKRREVPGCWTGTFVDLVCEIVLQLKPYLADEHFDLLPPGIMRAGMSDKEKKIIGQRCRSVLTRSKRA